MKTNNTKSGIVRQGDVLLVPTDEVPKNLKKTKKNILALGEATGHSHTLVGGGTCFADDENDLADFVSVSAPAEVIHQEHDAIVLNKKHYGVFRQVEYTPQEIRRVSD